MSIGRPTVCLPACLIDYNRAGQGMGEVSVTRANTDRMNLAGGAVLPSSDMFLGVLSCW